MQRGQLRREWATRRQTVWKAWEHMKTRKPASLRSRGAPRLSEQRAQSPDVRSTAAPQWWLVELTMPLTDTRQASSSRAAFSWAPTWYITHVSKTSINIQPHTTPNFRFWKNKKKSFRTCLYEQSRWFLVQLKIPLVVWKSGVMFGGGGWGN